jgi:hypothetical protein
MNVMSSRIFRLLAAPLLAAALSNHILAEEEKIPEVKTASGKIYKNVRITNVTPSEVRIFHEEGVGRIPFADLPDDLKSKLGYDPVKAEEHKQAVAKSAAKAQIQNAEATKKAAMLKSASAISARILRVHIDEGFVTVQAKRPESSVVASSSQSNGGGGGYYAPGGAKASTKPPRPSIYGYFAITNVPNLSKIADDEWVDWLVVPTEKTIQVPGGTTYKVWQYIGSNK